MIQTFAAANHALAETGLDGTILVTGIVAAAILTLAGIIIVITRKRMRRG